MTSQYVTAQCDELHHLVTEMYESFYDKQGSFPTDDEYTDVLIIMSEIKALLVTLEKEIRNHEL